MPFKGCLSDACVLMKIERFVLKPQRKIERFVLKQQTFRFADYKSSIETVTTVNDFTPIEVKDLPAAVQEAITKNYADLTIKEASVEAKEDGTKTYKVVLTDKEGTESTVLFSESGEVLK